MKKLLALILALAMVMSLAACQSSGNEQNDNSSSSGQSNTPEDTGNTGSTGNEGNSTCKSVDKIVLWTLSNDLKQFAERYTAQTGNEVEVVVFDSADFATKINQTLGTKSKGVDKEMFERQICPIPQIINLSVAFWTEPQTGFQNGFRTDLSLAPLEAKNMAS